MEFFWEYCQQELIHETGVKNSAVKSRVQQEIELNSAPSKRFSIEDKNYSMASRIIADTMNAGLVKTHDPESTSRKHAKYVPFWV